MFSAVFLYLFFLTIEYWEISTDENIESSTIVENRIS